MEAAIGLKVNWSKSTLSPVEFVPKIEELTNIISCDLLPLPISYLGLPFRAKASSKSIWNPVLEKMGSKLAHWKGNNLSYGGKLILLKSVLTSMPTYFLSFPSSSFCLMQDGEIAVGFSVGFQSGKNEDPLRELGHYL